MPIRTCTYLSVCDSLSENETSKALAICARMRSSAVHVRAVLVHARVYARMSNAAQQNTGLDSYSFSVARKYNNFHSCLVVRPSVVPSDNRYLRTALLFVCYVKH